MQNYKESRPWGTFENLLDEESCKVKQIIVRPNQSLSYQYHYKRSEKALALLPSMVLSLLS